MMRIALTTAAAILLAGCGGGKYGGTTTPSAPDRVVQNFDYTLRLTPALWPISGPEFTSKNGVIDVVARVDSPVAVVYQIDLLYLGGDVPHNEGSGGVTAQGPGPLLSGLWNVGFSGRFQAASTRSARPRSPCPPPASTYRPRSRSRIPDGSDTSRRARSALQRVAGNDGVDDLRMGRIGDRGRTA